VKGKERSKEAGKEGKGKAHSPSPSSNVQFRVEDLFYDHSKLRMRRVLAYTAVVLDEFWPSEEKPSTGTFQMKERTNQDAATAKLGLKRLGGPVAHQENGRCVFPRLSRLRGDLKT